jgi:hypothetical protein
MGHIHRLVFIKAGIDRAIHATRIGLQLSMTAAY